MRGGVADDLERGSVVVLEELEGDVFGERRGEIDNLFAARDRGRARVHRLFGGFEGAFVRGGRDGSQWTDARDDDGGGEARGDAVGDVERACAGGDLADGAVGKLDLDVVAHSFQG